MLNESVNDEFGESDARYSAAILGYTFAVDDYGIEFVVPPAYSLRRASSRATATVTTAAKIDPAAILTVLVANPKKVGSATYGRFALYVSGATVATSLKAGVLSGDIRWDRDRGFIRIDPVN